MGNGVRGEMLLDALLNVKEEQPIKHVIVTHLNHSTGVMIVLEKVNEQLNAIHIRVQV